MQLNLFGYEPSAKEIAKATRVKSMYEYFMLISPDYRVKQYVYDLKKKLHNKIGLSNENLSSVPHLSLILLGRKTMQDSYIVENVRKTLKEQEVFNIEISKAGTFEHIKTNDIILNVENPEPVKQIYYNLANQFVPGMAYSGFTPHIIIGRNIPKKDFEKVASSLDEFNYQAQFTCKSITVLRREVMGRVKTKYKVIEDVALN
jgi:2'-5' RNA ligase